MPATIAGKAVEIDKDGFLVNPNEWTEEIAAEIARQDGIELTDAHWKVIRFMRDDYKATGQTPTVRKITKNNIANTKEIYALFPGGPAKFPAKIGGLPKPKGCL
ncbi:sulfur relay protein, TusE/DsrC/DsvC family [Chloroherpeton thalassium ATCC 35110]|uniref:Sulfur relay protein, TusE/DsrC/DsvC family n=1 Tax=Chloroherpeton thalassium (strain ATCC 35110 / GB-78) TaxID=517418 RepID=B3QVR1_CHLT3|nr:TusE/DsrC/DsvC family sulfur relay protein [Chloroherpeton thalassium]ACF13118.1 sulfur relay protein, TusE/DsrC/DsvC family [Chloroherpeton thalassium ATCC 35110]